MLQCPREQTSYGATGPVVQLVFSFPIDNLVCSPTNSYPSLYYNLPHKLFTRSQTHLRCADALFLDDVQSSGDLAWKKFRRTPSLCRAASLNGSSQHVHANHLKLQKAARMLPLVSSTTLKKLRHDLSDPYPRGARHAPDPPPTACHSGSPRVSTDPPLKDTVLAFLNINKPVSSLRLLSKSYYRNGQASRPQNMSRMRKHRPWHFIMLCIPQPKCRHNPEGSSHEFGAQSDGRLLVLFASWLFPAS